MKKLLTVHIYTDGKKMYAHGPDPTDIKEPTETIEAAIGSLFSYAMTASEMVAKKD